MSTPEAEANNPVGNSASSAATSIEGMLTRALAPVDPPPHLYEAFESKLEQVSADAAEELSDWELAAMRDPRNWVKPAVAIVAGGTAAGALLVLGLRSRRREEDKGTAAVKALSGALGDVRREIERSARRGFK